MCHACDTVSLVVIVGILIAIVVFVVVIFVM